MQRRGGIHAGGGLHVFTAQNMLDKLAWQDLLSQEDVNMYQQLLLLMSYDSTHNGNIPGKKVYFSLKIASRIIKTGKFRFCSLL